MKVEIPGYEVIRTLGSGGMAIVYLARDVKLGRNVAIKVLLENLSLDSRLRDRFFNEAKMMAGMSHPNIVTLHDYIEFGNRLALVMEYVEGRTLDEMIGKETGPLVAERALPLFRQILSAVRYAHSRGIVHRDLKPSNIIFSSEGVVKVTDFGIAKITGEKGLTHTGTRKPGSIYYMPPEAIHGKESTPRSDVYSLGITLYEMLTGAMPFDKNDTSELQTMLSITNGELPDPRSFYPDIPDSLVDVVFRSVSVEPGNRYADCDEFMKALSAVDGGSSDGYVTGGGGGSVPPAVSSPSRLSSIPWKVAGPVLGALGLVGLFIGLSGGDPSSDMSVTRYIEPPSPSLCVVDSIPRGPYFREITESRFVGPDRIAVLDYVSEGGYLFDGSGDYVGDLMFSSVPGGSVGLPMGICGSPGGEVLLSDWGSGSILSFGPGGEYISATSGYPVLPPGEIFCNDDGSLVGADLFMESSTSAGYRITRWDAAEEPSVVYRSYMKELNRSSAASRVSVYSDIPLFCVSEAGFVYAAVLSSGRYDVVCYAPEGDSLFSFGLNVAPVLRDSVALASCETHAERLTGISSSSWAPDSVYPAAVSMGVDRFSRLWIRRGSGEVPVFDLFDASDGSFLFTLEMPSLSGWKLRISSEGILAFPGDVSLPQMVYMLDVEHDPAVRDLQLESLGFYMMRSDDAR